MVQSSALYDVKSAVVETSAIHTVPIPDTLDSRGGHDQGPSNSPQFESVHLHEAIGTGEPRVCGDSMSCCMKGEVTDSAALALLSSASS